MKKNKGFTLVELLAIIVLLGIIMLIIVPSVTKLTKNTKKKTFESSAYGLLRTAKLYYQEKDMLDEFNGEETFVFPDNVGELQYEGKIPESGTLTINEDGYIAFAITNGKYCAKKGYKDKTITVDNGIENCNIPIYVDTILNGADPVVKAGMIPVNIAPNGVVTKADTYSEWYNYANKKWANAVTVTEGSRANYMNAAAGTQIQESDILTYLVWIPRYRYELWNVGTTTPSKPTPHSIAITFENKDTTKSNGNTNGTYLTHPAFTFGDEELNGIWVGKFETGHKTASNPNSIDTANIVIKPNTYSWRSINVSNAFNTVQGMNGANNAFGLDATSDTHMMKNTEWGAVAYLSHSAYGKDGEVYINNANIFTTGCGGMAASASPVSTCDNAYGSKSGNEYNQSTTGNISGVFDMSGGVWEYVMGYTTGASTTYGSSGFATNDVIEDKYVDTYSSTTHTDYTNRKLGDATGEMGPFSNSSGRYLGSWYQDYAYFITSGSPWLLRGGNCNSITVAGVFTFLYDGGLNGTDGSFRITIA